MSVQDVLEHVELVEIIEHMEDDLKCQVYHRPESYPCSVDVTHVLVGHTRTLCCVNHAKAVQRAIDEGIDRCRTCGDPVATHWRLHPV